MSENGAATTTAAGNGLVKGLGGLAALLLAGLVFAYVKYTGAQEKIAALQDDLASVTETSGSQTDEIAKLKADVELRGSANSDLSETNAGLEKQLAEAGERFAALEKKHNDILDRLEQIRGMNQSLSATKEELEQREKELEQTTEELKTQNASLKTERDQVGSQAESFRYDLETLQSALNQMETRISDLQEERSRLQRENERLSRDNDVLAARMQQVTRDVRAATDLENHKRPVTPRDLRAIARRSKPLGTLIQQISLYRSQHVSWGIGKDADNPAEGFTSPAFAGFVLQRMGVLDTGQPPVEALATLPQDDGEPRPGDIALYEGGFALFHLEDARKKPFVTGMTFHGVVSLEPDFGATRTGVIRTGITP